MAGDIQIFIGTKEIEVPESEKLKLALTFSVTDITTLDSRSGGLSKAVVLPGSNANRQTFGFVDNVNSVGSLDQTRKETARIYQGGTLIMVGFAKTLNARLDHEDNVTGIEVLFFSDNNDWTKPIKDAKLSAVDWSDQNHIYSKDVIDTSETVVADRHYVYPLVNYGKFTQANGEEVAIQDRKFSFNVAEAIKRIFTGIGYKVNSVFFDSAYFQALYVPFSNEKLVKAIDENLLFQASVSGDYNIKIPFVPTSENIIKFDDDFTSPNNDPGNSFDIATFQYTVSKDWTMKFVAQIEVEVFKDLVIYVYFQETVASNGFVTNYKRIVGNNSGVSDIIYVESPFKRFKAGRKIECKIAVIYGTNQLGVISGISDDGGFVKVTMATDFPMKVGESMTLMNFKTNTSYNVDGLVTGVTDITNFTTDIPFVSVEPFGPALPVKQCKINETDINVKARNSQFFNILSDELIVGETVDVAANMPDHTQLEFIQGVKGLFNLHFYAKADSREVFIEPRDIFFKDITLAKNWSNKLDMDSVPVISFIGENLKKDIRYKYEDDSKDAFAELFADEEMIELAAFEQSIKNQFAEGKGTAGTNLFSPTYMDTAAEIGLSTNFIPKMWIDTKDFPNSAEFRTEFNTRILFYEGIKAMPAGEEWIFDVDTRTDYPYMYSVDETAVNNNSLYFNSVNTSLGLFDRFYRNTHKIYNEGRIVDARFFLTAVDIANLDFRFPIFLDTERLRGYYTIEKISDYRPGLKVVTKVRLLKIVGTDSVPDLATLKRLAKLKNFGYKSRDSSFEKDTNGNTVGGGPGNLNPGGDRSILLGHNLFGDGEQIILGQNNLRTPGAKMLLGGGFDGQPENLMSITNNGDIKVAGGYIFTTEGNPVTNEDEFGDFQFTRKLDDAE